MEKSVKCSSNDQRSQLLMSTPHNHIDLRQAGAAINKSTDLPCEDWVHGMLKHTHFGEIKEKL